MPWARCLARIFFDFAGALAQQAGGAISGTAGAVGHAVSGAACGAGEAIGTVVGGAGSAAAQAWDSVADFVKNKAIKIEDVISVAANIPGVRIDRDSYLYGALSIHTTKEIAEQAVRTNPANACVPSELIEKLADEAIEYESNLATATSFVAGIPSNLATMGPATVADLGQFYAHVLRIAQKLGYLYGWDDIFDLEGDQMDDATRNALVLFLGVMSGVKGAEKTLLSVAQKAGTATGKRIAKQALTKGTIYPIVKKIAYYLGIQMNKQIFGHAVGKAVPLFGGVVSGILTWSSFGHMATRLRDHLRETPLANPSNAYVADVDALDIDDLSEVEAELDQQIEEAERE